MTAFKLAYLEPFLGTNVKARVAMIAMQCDMVGVLLTHCISCEGVLPCVQVSGVPKNLRGLPGDVARRLQSLLQKHHHTLRYIPYMLSVNF